MLGRSVRSRILFVVAFILLSGGVILHRQVDAPHELSVRHHTAIVNTTTFTQQSSVTSISAEDVENEVVKRPFPRWHDNGIEFSPLMDFIYGTRNKSVTTVVLPKPRSRFPETLYIVDNKGVWVSRTVRGRNWNLMHKKRLVPTERLFVQAWMLLVKDDVEHSTRWKRLRHALEEDGFPFLAWYGDYKSCNHRNWAGIHSIPLFTTSAPVSCHKAFPIPAYQVILDAQPDTIHWDTAMQESRATYPWQSKIPKLVWRGSLSAPNEHWNSTRWRVCTLATALDRTIGDRLDIGLVSIPSINSRWISQINWTSIGGSLKLPIKPMADFQRYVAILDMDGNSWSSRFGALLCYNSVVVKVEPEFVEYFYFQGLEPWKHYIPVGADLTDFLRVATFVTDLENQQAVQEIVANANSWCREHLTLAALAEDLLDIWDVYLRYLDRGDQAWPFVWAKEKETIFRSDFDMMQLEFQ